MVRILHTVCESGDHMYDFVRGTYVGKWFFGRLYTTNGEKPKDLAGCSTAEAIVFETVDNDCPPHVWNGNGPRASRRCSRWVRSALAGEDWFIDLPVVQVRPLMSSSKNLADHQDWTHYDCGSHTYLQAQ